MIRPSNRLYLDSAKISGVLIVSIQNWSSNFLEIFSKFLWKASDGIEICNQGA